MVVVAAGPTAAIRPSAMMTVWSVRTASPVPSMTATWRNATLVARIERYAALPSTGSACPPALQRPSAVAVRSHRGVVRMGRSPVACDASAAARFLCRPTHAPAAMRGAARLAVVRIGVGAEFDEDGRCKEVVGLAKHVRKVASVALRHRSGLITVNHDARWITPALMRIAQLDAPPAHERRLVCADSLLERAGQLARRQSTHRRLVGACRRVHELADPTAVAGGDEMQRRERHEVELQCELSVDLLALLGRDPVPL